MKRFFTCFLGVLSLSWGIMTPSVISWAQTLQREDPLSRQITISYYKRDQTAEQDILVDRWDWLDYAEYYRLIALIPTSALASVDQIATTKDPAEKVIVTETSSAGDMLRFMILHNDMIALTTFSYSHVYYDDVLETAKALRGKILSEQKDKGSGDKNISSLLTFTLKTKDGDLVWHTNNPQDVAAIRAILEKSPKLSDIDQLRNKNDFNSTDHIRIDVDPAVIGMPQQIDFDRYQIRAVRITPSTRTYVDKHNLWEESMGQKALAEKYKKMGIGVPPKTY